MGSTLSTAPSTIPAAKQNICYLCSNTFDSIETLESNKRLEHNELG
jgi:hypothetical protein